MAVLTIAAFLSKYNLIFADNTTRAISEQDMRDFRQDIADSFQSVLGATTITSWKSPCAVATTANITLSGEQTIDGVLTSTSRVLVKDQTSTLQNGIYVSAAGAWARATDADSAGELEGAAVSVTQGTTQQNTVWSQTTDNITLETSAIAWQQVGYGSGITLIDDDTFATASPSTAPSSESTKAYVDSKANFGSYTPTITNVTNVASSSIVATFFYSKVGNIYHVAGVISVTATAGATFTELTLTLPNPIAASGSVIGVGILINPFTNPVTPVSIQESAGNEAHIRYYSKITSAETFQLQFSVADV